MGSQSLAMVTWWAEVEGANPQELFCHPVRRDLPRVVVEKSHHCARGYGRQKRRDRDEFKLHVRQGMFGQFVFDIGPMAHAGEYGDLVGDGGDLIHIVPANARF